MRFVLFSTCLFLLIGCSQNVTETKETTQDRPITTDNKKLVPAEQKVDHLIYVVLDLEKGIEAMEKLFQLRIGLPDAPWIDTTLIVSVV